MCYHNVILHDEVEGMGRMVRRPVPWAVVLYHADGSWQDRPCGRGRQKNPAVTP